MITSTSNANNNNDDDDDNDDNNDNNNDDNNDDNNDTNNDSNILAAEVKDDPYNSSPTEVDVASSATAASSRSATLV